MPLGSFRLNGIGKYFPPSGPVIVPDTWTATEIQGVFTNARRFNNNNALAIHGVQNNKFLVFSTNLSTNSPFQMLIQAGVVDLETGDIGFAAPVNIGNNTNNGAVGYQASVAGEGNQGMASVGTFDSAANSSRLFLRPFNFSNWGSITTTSLPNLVFGTSFTKTTSFAGFFPIEYCGNDSSGNGLYAVSQRDSIGDVSLLQVWRRNGQNAPSLYRSGQSGGNRRDGKPRAFRAGVSAGNWATVRGEPGNNNNTLASFIEHGSASSNQKTVFSPFDPTSGRGFDCQILKDAVNNGIFVLRIDSNARPFETRIGRWTNFNSPTQAAALTWGPVQNPFPGFIASKGNLSTTNQAYNLASGTSGVRFDILTFNESTLTFSGPTTGAETGIPNSGDRIFYTWYDDTWGQWAFAFRWTSNTIGFYANRYNP